MTSAPDGRQLIGPVVRLDRIQDSDFDALYAAIGSDQVYAGGFGGGALPADAEALRQGWGRSAAKRFAYVVRLAVDGPSGPAGTVIGRSSLGDVDVHNERIHLGWTA